MKQELIKLREATQKRNVLSFVEDKLAILENYATGIPEFRTAVLNELQTSRLKKDKVVNKFMRVIEKQKIFEEMYLPEIFAYLNEQSGVHSNELLLNYKIMNLSAAFESGAPALQVAKRFINEMQMFKHIPVIGKNVKKLQRIFESYSEDMVLYNTIADLKSSPFDLNQKAVAILENYSMDFGNNMSKERVILDLQPYMFESVVQNYVETLKRDINKSANINEKINVGFNVSNIHSILYANPNKMNENYFYASGDIYKANKSGVTKINKNHTIPSSFVEMNSLLETAGVIANDELSFVFDGKQSTMGIDDSNNPYFIFESKEISNTLNEGLEIHQNLSEEHYRYYNVLKKIYENIGNLAEIDTAKMISSKTYPGQYSLLMKVNENKYSVRLVNPIKNIDIFRNGVTLLEAKKLLQTNLDFNLTNSDIEKLVEADMTRMNGLSNKVNKIYSEIAILEQEYQKLSELPIEYRRTSEISELSKEILESIDELVKVKDDVKQQLHDVLEDSDIPLGDIEHLSVSNMADVLTGQELEAVEDEVDDMEDPNHIDVITEEEEPEVKEKDEDEDEEEMEDYNYSDVITGQNLGSVTTDKMEDSNLANALTEDEDWDEEYEDEEDVEPVDVPNITGIDNKLQDTMDGGDNATEEEVGGIHVGATVNLGGSQGRVISTSTATGTFSVMLDNGMTAIVPLNDNK